MNYLKMVMYVICIATSLLVIAFLSPQKIPAYNVLVNVSQGNGTVTIDTASGELSVFWVGISKEGSRIVVRPYAALNFLAPSGPQSIEHFDVPKDVNTIECDSKVLWKRVVSAA